MLPQRRPLTSRMLLVTVALFAAATAPMAAQQAPVTAPAASSPAAAQASLPGPRVRPNLRQVDPAFKAALSRSCGRRIIRSW